MTQRAVQILDDALQLNDAERGELAAKLISSLDAKSDPDVEAAWSTEIELRLQQLRSGEVRAVPWSEARAMILDDKSRDDLD